MNKPPDDSSQMPQEFDLDALFPQSSSSESVELPPDAVRPIRVTPTEERYPPLKPSDMIPPRKTVQTEAVPLARPTPWRAYLVTLLSWLGSMAVIVWAVLVWREPMTPLNPFSPQGNLLYVTATPDLPTPNAEGQILIVVTPTLVPPTEIPFDYAASETRFVANSNSFECEWWSIAGQVLNSDGSASNGIRVRIEGAGNVDTVFSGASQAWGSGGYELPLIGQPQVEMFRVQLVGATGNALSEEVEITTRTACEENVAVIDFVRQR